jgi:hypothetical protein
VRFVSRFVKKLRFQKKIAVFYNKYTQFSFHALIAFLKIVVLNKTGIDRK